MLRIANVSEPLFCGDFRPPHSEPNFRLDPRAYNQVIQLDDIVEPSNKSRWSGRSIKAVVGVGSRSIYLLNFSIILKHIKRCFLNFFIKILFSIMFLKSILLLINKNTSTLVENILMFVKIILSWLKLIKLKKKKYLDIIIIFLVKNYRAVWGRKFKMKYSFI